MVRTKKAKHIKPARSRKALRAKIRRTQPAMAQRPVAAYDAEDIFVDKILGGTTIPQNGTSIENLIYNATPKVAEIGYGFGFSVGREICLKQGEDKKIIKMLERIGFPDALYHPLKDSLIITSKPNTKATKEMGKSIHIYEAGIISGYLSVATGLKMNTTEKRCIYNRSNVCQFISIPMSNRHPEQKIELDSIVDGIAHSIASNNFKYTKNEYYRIMAYLPLMQQPMYEQVRRLLFMSGERMAQYSARKDARRIINNITNYFGVKNSYISLHKKGKSIIKLRYEDYNSIYPYVSMPTALIIGFVSKTFDKSAEVSISTNKDKTYTTQIDFKDNSE